MADTIVISIILVIAGLVSLNIYYDIREQRQIWKIWKKIQTGDVFLSVIRHENPFQPTEITPIVIIQKQDYWIQYQWPDGSLGECRYESFFEFWGFVPLESYNENNVQKYIYEPREKL